MGAPSRKALNGLRNRDGFSKRCHPPSALRPTPAAPSATPRTCGSAASTPAEGQAQAQRPGVSLLLHCALPSPRDPCMTWGIFLGAYLTSVCLQASVFSIFLYPLKLDCFRCRVCTFSLCSGNKPYAHNLQTSPRPAPSVSFSQHVPKSRRFRFDENQSTSHSFVECVGPILKPTGCWGSASCDRRTGSRSRGTISTADALSPELSLQLIRIQRLPVHVSDSALPTGLSV